MYMLDLDLESSPYATSIGIIKSETDVSRPRWPSNLTLRVGRI